MKKLITILFLTVLTSCGNSPSRTLPTSNTDFENIIGTTIKFGNLEIAQYDFPVVMNWDDAKEACKALGKGWRLPTANEQNELYLNKHKILGFANNYHWGIAEENSNQAITQDFEDGRQLDGTNFKSTKYYVRAVRTL